MAIKSSRFFNDPAMAQASSNLAALFEPPSGSDEAGYANARQTDWETDQQQAIWKYAQDPNADPALLDKLGVFANYYDPNASYKAVQTNADTLRSNNEADNIQKSAANKLDNLTELYKEGYGNVAPGEKQPEIPLSVLSQYGGTEAVPEIQGNVKPLSETEYKASTAAEVMKAHPELVNPYVMGTDLTTIMENGQPKAAYRFNAPGHDMPISETDATGSALQSLFNRSPEAVVDQIALKKALGTATVEVQGPNGPQIMPQRDVNGPVDAPPDNVTVENYTVAGPGGKATTVPGYIKGNQILDANTHQPIPNVLSKQSGQQTIRVTTDANGNVTTEIGPASAGGTGKAPEAQMRAQYVGVLARPAVADLLKAYDTNKLPTRGDYWAQYSIENAAELDPGVIKAMMDIGNEELGRPGMTEQGQAFYANMDTVMPLELLIQSGAAVNKEEAIRKRNQLKPRPSDKPATLAIRRRGLALFLKGIDQWARGEIDQVEFPDLENLPDEPAPAAAGAPAAAAPAAAAPAAPAAAATAPAATPAPAAAAPAAAPAPAAASGVPTPQTQEEYDALKPGDQYIDPDDPVMDDGKTPKIVTKQE